MENIKMIKKMVMVFLNGVMEGCIKVFGKMENKMEKVNFLMGKMEERDLERWEENTMVDENENENEDNDN